MDKPVPERSRGGLGLASRLLVASLLILVAGYVGYLALVLGSDIGSLRLSDWLRGYERVLEPAERRGAPLRTAQNVDRVYFLTTQVEHIVPLWIGRRSGVTRIRNMLHVDV